MNRNDSGARVALVTGGAMGIGASISTQLAAKGHTVLVADINLEAAPRPPMRWWPPASRSCAADGSR
jgi:NAD(P)-dependent dehydrogenase (short-subunit alcohol dehydrogenase family)